MANQRIARTQPKIIHHRRFVKNGRFPDAALFSRISANLNHMAHYMRRRTIVIAHPPVDGVLASASTTGSHWRAAFRTSGNTGGIRHYVGLAPVDTALGASSGCAVNLYTLPATLAHTEKVLNSDQGTTIDAENIYHARAEFTPDEHGVADDTIYGFTLTKQTARPFYWVIEEIPPPSASDSETMYSSPANMVREGPIYAQNIAALYQQAKELKKRCGHVLFSWCPFNATIPTTTSASYVDLFGGATTPTAQNIGWSIDPTYLVDKTQGLVRAEVVVGSTVSGSPTTRNFRIVDQTGATLVTVGLSATTSVWQSQAFSIGSGVTRLHAQAQSDGSGSVGIFSITVYLTTIS